jgi:NifU-like protein involved in Fe-S cluster formation
MTTFITPELIALARKTPSENIVNPTHTLQLENSLCGDSVTINLIVVDERIVQTNIISSGCLLLKASANKLTDVLHGATKEKIENLDNAHWLTLLSDNIPDPRKPCALLPLQAIQKLLSQ